MRVDIGISEENRKAIAEGFSRLLADSYTLYLKTHNYHWNVKGPLFHTLHIMFEEQYTELATAVDVIAERIRALGFPAPGSYSEFGKLTSITEAKPHSGREMVSDLVDSHETLIKTARSIYKATDAASDEASSDLLTSRIQTHEKTAWMLRSLLEDN